MQLNWRRVRGLTVGRTLAMAALFLRARLHSREVPLLEPCPAMQSEERRAALSAAASASTRVRREPAGARASGLLPEERVCDR